MSSHLDVEQPELEAGHGLLPQRQVPDHHVQGLVGEEALVDCGHAGGAADVPDGEFYGLNLLEQPGRDKGRHFTNQGLWRSPPET